MGKVSVPPLRTHKVIKDPIHGYISLTELEYMILQLPVFNRLHDLKQMSMAYLAFPGAVTTRFQHSIGVMHLASMIAYQALQSIDQAWLEELFPSATNESERLRIIETVRLAALLHDVGHGAFSHALEDVMRTSLYDVDKAEFDAAMKLFGVKEDRRLPVHEYYSYKLILDSELRDLFAGTKDGFQIQPEDVAALLTKTPKTSDLWTESGLLLLRKMVSSQLDSDRMDYLGRDAYMAGVGYGTVDFQRVIMNIMVGRDKRGCEFAVNDRALASVEDMLDARFKMYKSLYSHHIVVAANELLSRSVESLIAREKLFREDFYWKSFVGGRCSDPTIAVKLLEDSAKEDSLAKGLIDRRYLPVSLLKRRGDQEAFEADIARQSGRKTDQEAVRETMKRGFSKLEEEPQLDVASSKVTVLAVAVARSPYRPKPEDTVWLWSHREEKLVELTAASPYFNAINSEWASYPSFYVSYMTPGKNRRDNSVLLPQVREKLVEFIASA